VSVKAWQATGKKGATGCLLVAYWLGKGWESFSIFEGQTPFCYVSTYDAGGVAI